MKKSHHMGTVQSPLNPRRAKKAGLIMKRRYCIISLNRGRPHKHDKYPPGSPTSGRVHIMQHPTKTAEAYAVQAFYYNL